MSEKHTVFESIQKQMEQAAKAFLQSRGYQVHQVSPAPAQRPTAKLQIDFEFVVNDHLARVTPADFFFIQVGAFDGVTNDPLRPFIERYKWRGILLEPQKQAFQKLVENYREHPQLTFLNAAVADKDGTTDLYSVRGKDGLPMWSDQIASLRKDHVLKHEHGVPAYGIQEKIPDIQNLVQVDQVECFRLDTLFRTHNVARVDLLQIDAEGFDYQVIKTIDWDKIRPAIIHYEHMHLSQSEQNECLTCLMDHGYHIAIEFANTVAYLR